ncbi:MAG TPA: ThuA domain-containing protein [Flavisolibacter sp.]|jgi:glucose/arabinose dehydrogenase/cytochrome c551/c552|nr:ThuA domain-containing protein [Flavisolibacter sp.]
MTPIRDSRFFFLLLLFSLFIATSCNKRSGKPKVLLFSKTAAFQHSSIPQGIAAIQKLGSENNFEVDTTSNAAMITEDSLKQYAAVIFLQTTGDVLNHYQEADFERYIQSGGGFVGVHAAADAEYDWGWYGRLVGGYFQSHPAQQEAVLRVTSADHSATKHLPKEWKRRDEWYNFKKISNDITVLLTIDEKTYTGGENGDNHPMAWYHDYDGGRAFYTALGHTDESYQEEPFLRHLLAGILYAIGDNKELDYDKAKTLRVPEENRFAKTALVTGHFFEPTEMTVLPNLDVLVAQRRGEIMYYKNGDTTVSQAGFLNVYWKTTTEGVNAEEGVLGIKADPAFEKNHYIYIFYSPADTSVNRLSRFKFENGKLDAASEKIVLQFYSQREICCHTGGSIAFDKDGLLYVSTGDNTTPFDEPKEPHPNSGYAPIDQRPGHEQYDARRTSGNPADLRGKILRIRVKEDGSYEIPDGNLYPKNGKGTRPEIYVQGNRNPYRISIDQKTGYLYWGEVGPDASRDSLGVRGPRGYDEVNQAKKAGFYGWPLFVANNYAYNDFDFATGKPGQPFDPAKPVNNSRNNTGIHNLPPAQPAFIWYPYGPSTDFPQVGTGGRNAMAGPVYYTEMFPQKTRLPEYYNSKLFIYDWIRGWIKAVTMQPNGDFDKMEPFMESTRLNGLIDMEVGPDGKLYLLEYGSGWFSKNPDAGLSRIDFNAGNRAPVVTDIAVNKTSGALPLTITATATASDPEKDPLTYEWHLGNGITKVTKVPTLEHTFTTMGDYAIHVVVKDKENATARSMPVQVYAGNEAPVVSIAVQGNKSFYFPGKQVAYAVKVQDKDDATAASDLQNVFVSADYVEGLDKAGASMGHQVMTASMAGRSLVESLDCKGCHKETDKSIGPSYTDVAKKYRQTPDAMQHLVNKIIKGGAGVWGEVAMPGHPNLPEGDARQIVTWILSLSGGTAKQKSLPPSGAVNATLQKKPTENGVLVLSASYTDKGVAGSKPLTGQATVVLKNNTLPATEASKLQGYTLQSFNGMQLLMVPKGAASFSIDSIDLTGVGAVELIVGGDKQPAFGYSFVLHLDGASGTKLGEAKLAGSSKPPATKEKYFSATVAIPITAVSGGRLHSLYFTSTALNEKETGNLAIQAIRFRPR